MNECTNDKGLTICKLAYTIDMESQSIHGFEVGGVNPSFIYLSEICKVLDIDLKELLEDFSEKILHSYITRLRIHLHLYTIN